MRAASVLMAAQLLLAAEVHEWGELNATEWVTGWPEPNATTAGTLVRLGNHTLDSSKSFRVPSYSAPPELTVSRPAEDIVTTTAESPVLSMTSAPSRWSVVRPHHHQDRRYGPQFEDDGNTSAVVVQQGDTAHLNCRVSLLQDKTVSWTRRRADGALELLTVGEHTYAADPRYVVQRRYPGNWRLGIQHAAAHDGGVYECQISTHPPRVIRVQLRVNTPQVWIVDEGGAPLWEQYYEAESTLSLRCVARHVDAPVALAWWHEGRELNADTTRGGISVRTEQVSGGADSRLRLSRVSAADAGNYTCGVRGARAHTVAVHVLNESLAELHQGSGDQHRCSLSLLLTLLFTAAALHCS